MRGRDVLGRDTTGYAVLDRALLGIDWRSIVEALSEAEREDMTAMDPSKSQTCSLACLRAVGRVMDDERTYRLWKSLHLPDLLALVEAGAALPYLTRTSPDTLKLISF